MVVDKRLGKIIFLEKKMTTVEQTNDHNFRNMTGLETVRVTKEKARRVTRLGEKKVFVGQTFFVEYFGGFCRVLDLSKEGQFFRADCRIIVSAGGKEKFSKKSRLYQLVRQADVFVLAENYEKRDVVLSRARALVKKMTRKVHFDYRNTDSRFVNLQVGGLNLWGAVGGDPNPNCSLEGQIEDALPVGLKKYASKVVPNYFRRRK